jgi:dCMP deaminase
MTTDTWHRRFMAMALLVSTWSKDPSTRVGAVAVRDRRVLATGYNGLPRGVADLSDRLHDRAQKLLMTSHAETNVIGAAAHHGVSLAGATVYVTLWPCSHCAAQLINAGVAEVVIRRGPIPDRWATSFTAAETMLYEAGVTFTQLAPSDD